MKRITLTSENKQALLREVESKFPNCEVTQRRISNNVFNSFIGRVLIIEENTWYFDNTPTT